MLLAGCDTGALKYFTVSFETFSEIPEPSVQKVQKGGLIAEPEKMAKDGHDLAVGTRMKNVRYCGILNMMSFTGTSRYTRSGSPARPRPKAAAWQE